MSPENSPSEILLQAQDDSTAIEQGKRKVPFAAVHVMPYPAATTIVGEERKSGLTDEQTKISPSLLHLIQIQPQIQLALSLLAI
jgi:hypothetical protein